MAVMFGSHWLKVAFCMLLGLFVWPMLGCTTLKPDAALSAHGALSASGEAEHVVRIEPPSEEPDETAKEALKLPDDKVQRITFEEFTKPAIARAFEDPGSLRMDLVNAQQARRILDRIVGYKISPFLWKRIKPGLSAGRVQSVAVRLIVDREREIRAFEARPHGETVASAAGVVVGGGGGTTARSDSARADHRTSGRRDGDTTRGGRIG